MNPNATPNANQSNAAPSAAPHQTSSNPLFQNSIPTTVKSSVAAGLLGIFLGAFGAHNWYLGENKKGVMHVALTGGGFLLTILSAVMVALTAQVPFMGFFFGFLMFIAYIAIMGSGIWGFVEGIIILVQGDAALAAKGYTVATPATYAQPAAPAAPAANTEDKVVAEEPKAEAKAETKEAKDDKKTA